MKRVLIAVITEADVCSASFCVSLTQSVRLGYQNQIEIFPVFFPADGNWSMAFNRAATICWQENLDGFLCISPRTVWEAEALLSLLETKYDAVVMPVSSKDGFNVSLGDLTRLQQDPESGEIKILGSGLDFIYLSPLAIKRLCESHHYVSYRGSNVKLIIQSGDIYTDYLDPGDILAYRLKEMGIEMMAHVRHTAARQETVEYTSIFTDLLSR